MVGFLNPALQVEPQNPEHYKDADWVMLQNIWDRLAYPGLYPKEEPGGSEAGGTEKKPGKGTEIIKWMKSFTRLEPKHGAEETSDENNISEPVQQS